MFWTEDIERDWGRKEEYGLADVVSGRLVGRTRVENSGTWWTTGMRS